LLAFASAGDRGAFIARHGLPSASEWPEASGSEETLTERLEEIRQKGAAELARDTILAIAVPLVDPEGNLVAALGMFAPAFRSDDSRRAELRRLLIEGAAQILV
jgi:DNA-binding IclR family transcriptional regulator